MKMKPGNGCSNIYKTMTKVMEDNRAEQLRKILELSAELAGGCSSEGGKTISDDGERQLDKIIVCLQLAVSQIEAKNRFIAERTTRLNLMLDVLLEYTLMDFSQKITISSLGDEVDAVALGINTLGEELDSHINQLREKTEDLIRSNKQLEEFVFIASHDLQEPLKTLTNYTNLLQEETKDKLNENATRYVTRLTSATERMRLLITDLLEFARVGKDPTNTEVDCNVLAEEVLSDMVASIESNNASITVKKLPVVRGNYTELKSLFQNLLSNAIKFKKQDVNPIIHVSATSEKNEWTFAVADNGIGIEERFYDRIFSIFQKLHSRKQYQGTGIGLAHCKKVVEHHHGNIWLKSEPGKGSTFYFTIPKTEYK
jgi:signal transduction histidine kinase